MKTKTQKWRRWFARKILRFKYHLEIDASIVARGVETGKITINGEPPSDGDSLTLSGSLDLRNDAYEENLKYGGTFTFKDRGG